MRFKSPASKKLTSRENEHVISLGSFSKILAPGLRLGWIQADAEIIKRLVTCGLLDSGGGMKPFTSAIVRGVIETGDLEKNIGRLRLRYQSQLSAMNEALRLHLPEFVYHVPTGGYFLWLRLPENVKAIELRPRAKSWAWTFVWAICFLPQGQRRITSVYVLRIMMRHRSNKVSCA